MILIGYQTTNVMSLTNQKHFAFGKDSAGFESYKANKFDNQKCSQSQPTFQSLATFFCTETCPDGSTPVTCASNPCDTSLCDAFPDALCTPSYCGGCQAEYHNDDGQLLDCTNTGSVLIVPRPEV